MTLAYPSVILLLFFPRSSESFIHTTLISDTNPIRTETTQPAFTSVSWPSKKRGNPAALFHRPVTPWKYSPSNKEPCTRLTATSNNQDKTVKASSSSPPPPPSPPPLSRFLRALYKGVTFPFPTLRHLTLEGASASTASNRSSTDGGDAKGQLSLRQAAVAMGIFLGIGTVAYLSTSHGGSSQSLVDALYFSVVTLTTVGYGDLCPISAIGKIVTILFGLSGIAILGLAISSIGSRLVALESEMLKNARKATRKHLLASWVQTKLKVRGNEVKEEKDKNQLLSSLQMTDQSPSTDVVTDDCNETVLQLQDAGLTRDPRWITSIRSIISKSLPSFALIILGGAVMGHIEGWSLLNSCYYAFITAVTLGYGDFAPVTKRGRLWALVFIPLAVAAAGEVLGNIATQLQQRRQHQFYNSLLKRQLNFDRLAAMDTDHDGKVSREEYVQFMLMEMELVTEQDFADLHAQFEKLDITESGFLDKDDIKK
jgi:hypothetical protein